LGAIEDEVISLSKSSGDRPVNDDISHFKQIINDLRLIFSKHHLRVELVRYPNQEDLDRALMDKEVHAICVRQKSQEQENAANCTQAYFYQTTTRLRRLYDIMQTELASPLTRFDYVSASDSKEVRS
jgi:putative multicomponent Na+:H+ antiporter subunit B